MNVSSDYKRLRSFRALLHNLRMMKVLKTDGIKSSQKKVKLVGSIENQLAKLHHFEKSKIWILQKQRNSHWKRGNNGLMKNVKKEE